VEDNADVRTYIRGALEPRFNIEEATSGKEGMDKAKDIIPDLVISDIMMPELDGYELCARLKKDIKTSHIPVILLTAKACETSIARGLETGADDYITKPFNAKLLIIRVKNLIRLRRQLLRKIQDEMMLQPGEISISSIDKKFIKEIKTIIEENLSDPEFSVEQMAKKLYMSSSSLYKKIEAITGQSPQLFIRSYRLKRAAQLLKAKAGNVTEVAFDVGFSSTSYFTKCFKEKFHRLPSEY
jgi:DNA-binding response OmpR family regulator